MSAEKEKKERNENAVLTILSTQTAEGETDRSELNTTAVFSRKGGEVTIQYTELDDTGNAVGETVITVLSQNLVTIHKIGFAEAVMVLEKGKTHPVKYSTVFGRLQLRYLIDIGDSYSAVNTIDLRVRLR